MKRIASWGVDMTNYFGTFHPSQTNYLASIAGEQCGWTTDAPVWPLLRQRTVVDLLFAASLEWKAYMEGFPACPWNPAWATPAYYAAAQPPVGAPPTQWPPDAAPSYWQKHNPFASFLSTQFEAGRWQRIVNLEQFFADVENHTLPQYSWITPNIWNDGHYLLGTKQEPADRSLLIDQSARWLTSFFFGRLGEPGAGWKLPPRTLVVLTYDESDFEDTLYEGPNRIYTVLLGDVVEAGTTESEPYNHYSLLRTIEENFALGTLGKNDAGSNWFRFLWQERFGWAPPLSIPAESRGAIAAAAYDDRLFLVTVDAAGHLLWQTYDGKSWSPPAQVGRQASGPFALAATGSGLLLVYQASGGQELFALPYSSRSGWGAAPIPLGVETGGRVALTALPSGGFLLVYTGIAAVSADSGLPIYSLLLEAPLQAPTDASPLALGRSTEGYLALATLGSTVYLVYGGDPAALGSGASAPGSPLFVASYETAFFNTIDAGSSTASLVAYQWSPPPAQTPAPPGGLYVVGQVSHKSGKVDGPPPTTPTLTAPGSAIALAELDGCVQLTAFSAGAKSLIAETFSLSGVMTAAAPTALAPSSSQNTGYGTLMEAGWGPVEKLGLPAEVTAPLAMAAYQDAVYLFYFAEGSAALQMAVGRTRGGKRGAL